uniref:Glucosylceramidase n=1 Tax=Acrobeloides nanus TaxID=290746 RepID=A0A914DUD6_9BILA
MKQTGHMISGGTMIGEVNGPYYRTWANYFVRFFEEYAKNNITFWGVTMQNEPSQATNLIYGIQEMYYNGTMER